MRAANSQQPAACHQTRQHHSHKRSGSCRADGCCKGARNLPAKHTTATAHANAAVKVRQQPAASTSFDFICWYIHKHPRFSTGAIISAHTSGVHDASCLSNTPATEQPTDAHACHQHNRCAAPPLSCTEPAGPWTGVLAEHALRRARRNSAALSLYIRVLFIRCCLWGPHIRWEKEEGVSWVATPSGDNQHDAGCLFRQNGARSAALLLPTAWSLQTHAGTAVCRQRCHVCP